MKSDFDIRYDRRVSSDFLRHFMPEGVFAFVIEYARTGLFPLDVHLRRDPKSSAQHLTLYVGLTSVLDVQHAPNGELRLRTHATHQKSGGFDSSWTKPRSAEDWVELAPAVELYLERVIPRATKSHGLTEGAVQTAVVHAGLPFVALDREVTPSFRDTATRKQILDDCAAPIFAVLDGADLGFSGIPKKLGSECDVLALDEHGGVVAIEVKPYGGSAVAWAPAQALMYARVLQRWIDESSDDALTVLAGTAEQRQRIGLLDGQVVPDVTRPVTPVVALQRGASAEMIRRMRAARDVLRDSDQGFPEVQLYEVSLTGRLVRLDESRLPDGTPQGITASYIARHNAAGAAWKATLPQAARAPGLVKNRAGEDVERDYLLPDEHADLNLLPEVRDDVLRLFTAQKISWHQGKDGHPSTHTRSSQVQCVNALGQMMDGPDRIVAAFGQVLDIAEVRDLGEIDPREKGLSLSFEFIGETDYLSEGKRGKRTKGAQCTSVDAAFAYRTSSGADELALVEWKFTESYPSRDSGADKKLKERTKRYGELLADPDCPIDTTGLELADLFHDPIYQLVRQQLLAWQLEVDETVPVDRVRVVHVLSPDNRAYEQSYRLTCCRGAGRHRHCVMGPTAASA